MDNIKYGSYHHYTTGDLGIGIQLQRDDMILDFHL